MKRYTTLLFWLLVWSSSYGKSVTVDSSYQVIKGQEGVLAAIQPGDTIWLMPGTYKNLRLQHITGTKASPIVIQNHPSGKAVIQSDHYYGISIYTCQYIRLTGSGSANHTYGIEITEVNGNGIGATHSSFGLEIDHINIHHIGGSGIQIKTEAECDRWHRSDLTLYDIEVHHNSISHTRTEGLYIGSTQFTAKTIPCENTTLSVENPMLDKVSIHHNLLSHTGWDAIQLASARNSSIYNNTIEYDSQGQTPNQMSGIAIGAGADPSVFNNVISYGKGNGISSFGLSGQKIYNNIILYPGYNTISVYGNYGIYLNDKVDTAFNNLIAFPNVGMKYDVSHPTSATTLCYNNLITAPQELAEYTKINQTQKAFIQMPSFKVDEQNNIYLEELISDWFADISTNNFEPTENSGVIDAGSPLPHDQIIKDMQEQERIKGRKPDVGPYESPYQFSSVLTNLKLGKCSYTTPVSSTSWRWTIQDFEEGVIDIELISGRGEKVREWKKLGSSYRSSFELDLPTSLESGVYLIIISQNGKRMTRQVVINFVN